MGRSRAWSQVFPMQDGRVYDGFQSPAAGPESGRAKLDGMPDSSDATPLAGPPLPGRRRDTYP